MVNFSTQLPKAPQKAKKVLAVLLLASCLHTQAATTSFAQNLNDKTITVNFNHVSLKDALSEVEKKSGFRFIYESSLLDSYKDVSLQVSEASVAKVLEQLLSTTSVTYQEQGEKIIITRKDKAESRPSSQQGDIFLIKGKVVDAANPLPGVSVVVKGTSNGTVTSVDGSFEIRVRPNDVLVFSMIGFQPVEHKVSQQDQNINITLKENLQSLGEVVVVGYGTQKKENVTGAVEMITAEALDSRPITSLESGLQGLLPGLTAISNTGFPGASGATLRVRGTGTLNNSEPFVLVDGMPGIDISSLNPDDVESISVLKDAASASIYGSRAANGVILITTKKGQANQKPTVGYNGYYGLQTPTALPKMLGSVEYMEMLNESQRNVDHPLTFTDEQIQIAREGSDPDYYANTNWSDALLKDYAPQQSHNVSINGGTPDLNYYASYGRLNQEGLVVGDQYKATRNNMKLRLGANKLFDLLDLDANLSYVDREQNQPAGGTDYNSGPIYQTFTMSPLTPVRFQNGEWGYGGGSSNPVAVATDGGYNNFKSQEFYGNLAGTVHILKNLSLRAQYGVNIFNQLRSTFSRKIDYLYPETGDFWYSNMTANQLANRDYTSRLENLSGQLNYNVDLSNHHLSALLGYQQEEYKYEAWFASKMGFVSDDVPVFNLGSDNPIATGDAYQYALRSYFGRINYNYKEKYLAEFNLRYDGSSRYAPEYRYGAFPSASVGWRFTEENFIQQLSGLSWLTEGKVRASYGDLGGQYGANGPAYSEWYPYIPVMNSIGTMPIGNKQTLGLAQTILSNAILQWEKANMLNVGVDLGMFRNRMTFSADWFEKQTKDIQLKVPQPSVIGLTVPDQNAGSVSNKGWEVSLGWRDQISDFTYGFNAQLSDVKNNVENLGGAPPEIGDRIRQVGFPIDAFYGYQTDGLAQESDFSLDPATGKLSPNFPTFDADKGKVGPGDVKYRDISGPEGVPDGIISADYDRTVIGDAFPRYTYSFRGDFGYKGFDFSFFIQGVGKGNGYVSGVGMHPFYANGAFPHEVHRDRWTPENTDAWYPRFTYSDSRNLRVSDYWLQDASYLRLKNVQLGYTIPKQLTNKLRIDNLRVYVSADNLLTKTDFFYAFDPEVATTNGGTYPQVKTFIFGLNLRFK
ncbi:TonB-dependent receptor [Pontibacter korlensis]|uniref:TonB-dependent receptor n=1 Tax=Pontibacter korlensis TaxID=400092 RepID=UPI000698BE8F|nr:TonB-dependent receptor [Pontibacter korlensis]